MSKKVDSKRAESYEPSPALRSVARFICVRSDRFGDRIYSPGEILEVELGTEVPAGFMAMELGGPDRTVSTGPYFFALKECSRNGVDFKPGELWPFPAFKGPPPEGLFAPLAERDRYEFLAVSNNPRAELRRKPEPPPEE